MVNKNDFKLLNLKCEAYFNVLEKDFAFDSSSLSSVDKQRLGFYLFMLESICDVKDTADIVDMIIDTEFNKIIRNKPSDDFGVDAVFIDDENFCINLFNFKFRESFKQTSQQGVNDLLLSSKFLTMISNEDFRGSRHKTHNSLKNILEKNNSSTIWKTKLYFVSNDSKELDVISPEIEQFSEMYAVEVEAVALEKIIKTMSIRPKPLGAVLMLDKDVVLPFVETNLSSATSYVIKIFASDLIRITCDRESFRKDYAMENFSPLTQVELDYGLLFDNVRGLVLRSKINKKILKTLEDEPSKFFMYNNGLTLTATNITTEDTNLKKKIKIELENFQVVNGGQTLRTIHDFNRKNPEHIENFLSNCQILLRVFKVPETTNDKNKIAEFTNSQNSVSVVDLKALAYEQIQIEQYLDQKGIIYTRKSGDIGLSADNKRYRHRIGIEKFGQILFSVQGSPEKTSNQKKQIFERYYEQIFITNFDIHRSAELVELYFEIKRIYELKTNFETTDQKIFYILYMSTKLSYGISDLIDIFERVITAHDEGKKADARKLIGVKFKERLDREISQLAEPVKKSV
ncbi:MAG: AIPR family protein [Formosimonas sp.]